ncbi:DUF6377 domain-containing protein [Sphingobacterium lactis]|uniref:DUF6377 domain-containing protein n=1 Tax=Sphingobacterium lactis TaxID=797291 RepID=UPI003F7DEFCE
MFLRTVFLGMLLALCQFALANQVDNRLAVDSVEKELQNTLARKLEFERIKLREIFQTKQRLHNNVEPENRYKLYTKLYEEFRTYQMDSAIYYVNLNLKIANDLQDKFKHNQSAIQLAGLYSSAGRFIESNDILKGIPRNGLETELLADYYRTYSDFYSHYGQSTNYIEYFTRSEIYRDSLLAVIPKNSVDYRLILATRNVFSNNQDKAEAELLQLLEEYKEPQHERAVIAYLLGIVHKSRSDREKQIYYFAMSAITDIKNSVKDNASLQSLALVYFEKNDIDKAYIYIQEALDDALFCNVRYRTIENSSFYPIINSAFQEKEQARKKQLTGFLYTISIMSFLLLLVLIIVYLQMKHIKKARKHVSDVNQELQLLNAELLKVNKDLQETNLIKEEYMAQFFELCSSYIDKLDHNRKSMLKKLSNKQYDELNKELKSQDYIKTELDDLYHNFDVIFLSLYPTFIHEFNKLLKPEEQITLKPDELLNSELRIFALIRLGISDSTKIARFLRYSLRTVYNYRVKVKNKVVGSKEDFDERIKEIGKPSI